DCFWIEGIGQNLQRLIAAWDEDRMDALLLLTGAADASGYEGRGDFQMDAVGQLQRRKPNTDAPFVFAGASIASPRLFRETPDGAFSLNRIWDRAIDDGRLFGVRMDGIWMHVGTPDAIDEAERRLQDHAT
ncbi:MAG: nucleotidyltransferase family protein, partial [Pseudomonadota bacterium]